MGMDLWHAIFLVNVVYLFWTEPHACDEDTYISNTINDKTTFNFFLHTFVCKSNSNERKKPNWNVAYFWRRWQILFLFLFLFILFHLFVFISHIFTPNSVCVCVCVGIFSSVFTVFARVRMCVLMYIFFAGRMASVWPG